MQYKELFGIVAAIIGLIGLIPYLIAIFNGKTIPHRTSYGVWSILSSVSVVSYLASGARTSALLPVTYTLGIYIVFCLSFKRGIGGTSKLDVVCLIGALFAIIGWIVTKNPHVALYLSILASLFGFLTTLKKTFLLPHTENSLSWGLDVIAATLNIFALANFKLYLVIYPLYTFGTSILIVALTLFPQALRSKANTFRA